MNITASKQDRIRDHEENEKVYGYTPEVLKFYGLSLLYEKKSKYLKGYYYKVKDEITKTYSTATLTTHQRVRDFMNSVDGCKFINKELKKISNKNLTNETV